MMREQESAEEVERQRIAFLRRHRVQQEQRLRLDTERRVQECGGDRREISDRQEDVRREKAVAAQGSHALKLPGTYADLEQLDAATLQLVADRGALKELAPLNTRGKYHSRSMRDRFPIAGSQLKLEKEHESFLAAKKKLLLDGDVRDAARHAVTPNGGSLVAKQLFRSSYSKLDYYVGMMTKDLEREQEHVLNDRANRQLRLIDVQHQQGLDHFWTLVKTGSSREVVAWLRSHSFRDVNVPVRIAKSQSSGVVTAQLDRDFGITPLMAACAILDATMVVSLLDQGAAVQLTTGNGDSALHFLWKEWREAEYSVTSDAAMKGVTHLVLKGQCVHQIMEKLLSRGADANAQNAFGETPLQYCAKAGLEECAKLLLSHGADAFVSDRTGKSAGQYALEHHHDNLHRILLNFSVIERVKAREAARNKTAALMRTKRGLLTTSWSQPAETLLRSLAVEDQRVGHMRNQYIDRQGNVIVSDDD